MPRKFKMPRPGQQLSSKELKRLASSVQRHDKLSTGIGIGHGIGISSTGGGDSIINNRYQPFFARIVGNVDGNPRRYDFIEVAQDTRGVWITKGAGRGASNALQGHFPAYEINGRKVPDGEIVLMELGYSGNYYLFWWSPEGPVPAQITEIEGEETTAATSITEDQEQITVPDFSLFPARNGFLVKLTEPEEEGESEGEEEGGGEEEEEPPFEIVKVTEGAGTAEWTIERAQMDTEAMQHEAGARIVHVGAYAWEEVSPDHHGQWETAADGLSGSIDDQPAFDRNRNVRVPQDTYVLLWRRFAQGSGQAALAIGLSTTTGVMQFSAFSDLPAHGTWYAQIEWEIVKITARGGAVCAIERGQFGTAPAPHLAPVLVREVICEWVFDYCCREDCCDDGGEEAGEVPWYMHVEVKPKFSTQFSERDPRIQSIKYDTWSDDQDDYPLWDQQLLQATLTTDVTLSGIGPPTGGTMDDVEDGTMTEIMNTGDGDLTIEHASSNSTAEHRFNLPDNLDMVIKPRATAAFKYNKTVQRWYSIFRDLGRDIGAHVFKVAGGAAASGTPLSLAGATVDYDTGGFWSNGSPTVFTCAVPGRYLVTWSVRLGASSIGDDGHVSVYGFQDGSTEIQYSRQGGTFFDIYGIDPDAIDDLLTTESADGTYSSNEEDMLNHLKDDVINLHAVLVGAVRHTMDDIRLGGAFLFEVEIAPSTVGLNINWSDAGMTINFSEVSMAIQRLNAAGQ